MTDAETGFVEDLRREALAAQAEEIRFRNSVAAEIASRERARAFAFRRLGLMRAAAAAAAGLPAREEVREAVLAVLKSELGWSGVDEARARVLDAFATVADAVWRAPDPARGDGPSPVEALAAFEAWYADVHNQPFLAAFDQEPMEGPFVEF